MPVRSGKTPLRRPCLLPACAATRHAVRGPMTKVNDATDRRLLALLQANARESTATLARKLGIARTTVQERIARLQRNGTIAGYSVVLRRDPFENYAEIALLISV